MDDIINVCYITDSNYFIPTLTSIMSLSENCKNNIIHIHVVCSDISSKNITSLKKLQFETCKIFIKKVENPYLNLGNKHRHVSKTALLKFSLPEIFSDIDKILYLDSDILVYKDLAELYHIDLQEQYAAVVSDMKAVLQHKCNIDLNLKNYFNSGVMLLNLKKMRSDSLSLKFAKLKQEEENQKFMDQDVINKCFDDNVIFLNPKFNLQYDGFSNYKYKQIAEYYKITEKEVISMYKNPTILHLTNYIKPWNSIFCPNFKKWFYYFSKIPFINLKIYYYNRLILKITITCIKEFIRNIKFLIEKIFTYIIPIEINKKKIEKQIIKNKNICLNQKPRKENIIISLTSFPERIFELKFCLYSLFEQSLKPDKIVLYLAEEEFYNKENDLPIEILNFKNYGLEIRWINNLCSYKKLIYALKDFPNSIIVTVDDDIFYDKDFLIALYNSYKKNPDYIHANRVHKIIKNNENNILPYKNWIKEIDTKNIDYANFLTGVGGVLYPPQTFNDEVFNENNFKELCPYADDIWFWAMGILNNKMVKATDKSIYYKYINLKREKGLNNETTLAKKNVGESYNDKQFSNILEKYPLVKNRLMETIKTKEVAENSLKAELPKIYFRICSRIIIKLFNKIYKMKRY